MKTASVLVLALAAAALGGCAVVPLDPYGPPVAAYGPAATVVVRPAYRYHGYYGGRGYRYWR